MVNYLVPLDYSDFSKAAFFTALGMMHPETDHLYLLGVADQLKMFTFGTIWNASDLYEKAEEEQRKSITELLQSYGKLAHKKGVHCDLMLGISDHVGEMICQAIDQKKIDFLIMGRRGMSTLQRIFMGSTSRYCVEHANCNVVICKHLSPEILAQMHQALEQPIKEEMKPPAMSADTEKVREAEPVQPLEKSPEEKKIDERTRKTLEEMQASMETLRLASK